MIGINFYMTLEGLHYSEILTNIDRVILGRNFDGLKGKGEGLHVKHALQREIWVPAQHLLKDRGKPRKTLIELAGRRTCRMQTISSK
jgi:hypothetical protein